MAVTRAREDRPADQPSNVHFVGDGQIEVSAAIGGVENAKVENEGVATRGVEGDKKAFQEADEFMKSKAEFGKALDESEKQVAKGKVNTSVQHKLLKQEEKVQKEAEKKVTVPGANPSNLNSPVNVQTPKQTEKSEAADVAKSQASVEQARGNVEGAEKKKEEAKKLEDQVKEEKKGGK